MPRFKLLTLGSLLTLVLFGSALAQENRAPIAQPSETASAGHVVTAAATADRVRFVSPGSVVQLRLEVYNEAGQKLFDTELRGGNVLDWHLQDGVGQRLPAGTYAGVLTSKALSGRLSQRIGFIKVDDKRATIGKSEASQLSLAQQQAIGPIEGDAAFTIVPETEAAATTAVTHDGTDGQLTSTSGAITFRTGNVFAGKDKEQMRITEDGKVGIGTDQPQATLDVAGTVRVSEGVKFADGSTLQAAGGKLSVLDANGETALAPATAGTGTQNRVAKWIETGGAGTLGDTQITENNGSVVVGNAGQTGNIQIFGGAAQDVFAGMGPDINAGPAFNYGYAGGSFGRSAGFFNIRPDASAVAPNPSLRFMTANVERMIVTNTGNVGIGTTAPIAKFHVFGNSNDAAVPVAVIHSLGTSAPLSFRTGLSAVERARISVSGGGGLQISTISGSAPDIRFDAGNDDGAADPDLFIESTTGNVGIGTTVPRLPLTVGFADVPVLASALSGVFKAGGAFAIARDTTSDVEALFGADENGAIYGSMSDHNVKFRTNNTSRMTIQTNGDVVFGNDTTIKQNGDVIVGQVTEKSNLSVTGRIFLGTTVGSEGPNLCLSESTGGIGICSSSLRYKKDVFRFTPGLDLISRLRPVSFRWKESGRADIGLIAEEVERVLPSLVTYNKDEVQGVKYDRLGVLLLNAVREQQAQIKSQQQQLKAKDARINKLEARLASLDAHLASIDQRLRRRRTAHHISRN
jgi:uncharacterized membrane protein